MIWAVDFTYIISISCSTLCSQRSQSTWEDYEQVGAEQRTESQPPELASGTIHEITAMWLLRLTVPVLPRSQKGICCPRAEGKTAPLVIANPMEEYSFLIPDLEMGFLCWADTWEVHPAPPKFPISGCANLQRMKRRWKRKQKPKTNVTETKLIIKEGGWEQEILPGLYRQPAEALKHRLN